MPNARNSSNFYDLFCVLIGLGLQYFDRMCASCLLFPRCRKSILAKSRVTRFWHPTDDVLCKKRFLFQAFSSNLAKRHHQRQLCRKVWDAWHSVIENKWRQRMEKACQSKAQEVCVQITNDYESRLASVS